MSRPNFERDVKILAALLANRTLVSIGAEFGLTGEAVRQVIHRHGASVKVRCAATGCEETCARSSGLCREHQVAVIRGRRRERRPCWVPGCGKPSLQHRLCVLHWGRARFALDESYKVKHAAVVKKYQARVRAEGGEQWERLKAAQKRATKRWNDKQRAGKAA